MNRTHYATHTTIVVNGEPTTSACFGCGLDPKPGMTVLSSTNPEEVDCALCKRFIRKQAKANTEESRKLNLNVKSNVVRLGTATSHAVLDTDLRDVSKAVVEGPRKLAKRLGEARKAHVLKVAAKYEGDTAQVTPAPVKSAPKRAAKVAEAS